MINPIFRAWQPAVAGLAALTLASCVPNTTQPSGQSGTATSPASAADMAASCREQAAATFALEPRDVSTLPVKKIDGGYRVYGSRDDLTFECLYDDAGMFRSVRETLP